MRPAWLSLNYLRIAWNLNVFIFCFMPLSVQRKELAGICWHIFVFGFWLFAFYFLKASPQMLPFVVAALLQAMQKMLNKWQQCELGLTTYTRTKADRAGFACYTYFCTHCAIVWWVWCVCVWVKSSVLRFICLCLASHSIFAPNFDVRKYFSFAFLHRFVGLRAWPVNAADCFVQVENYKK